MKLCKDCRYYIGYERTVYCVCGHPNNMRVIINPVTGEEERKYKVIYCDSLREHNLLSYIFNLCGYKGRRFESKSNPDPLAINGLEIEKALD